MQKCKSAKRGRSNPVPATRMDGALDRMRVPLLAADWIPQQQASFNTVPSEIVIYCNAKSFMSSRAEAAAAFVLAQVPAC